MKGLDEEIIFLKAGTEDVEEIYPFSKEQNEHYETRPKWTLRLF